MRKINAFVREQGAEDKERVPVGWEVAAVGPESDGGNNSGGGGTEKRIKKQTCFSGTFCILSAGWVVRDLRKESRVISGFCFAASPTHSYYFLSQKTWRTDFKARNLKLSFGSFKSDTFIRDSGL